MRMGLFSRWRKTEERAITADDIPWDQGGSFGRHLVSQDKALTLDPVFAANRHLGDLISTLPIKGYRRLGSERAPMPSLPSLFRLLHDSGELVDWLFAGVVSLGLRGNAVGLITRFDGMGFPLEVVWLPMSDVHVDDSNFRRPRWFYRGRQLNPAEVVHIPWFKIPGRTLGLSPIEAFALTVTSGLEAKRYGADWFEAGGVPPGTFKNTEKTVDSKDAEIIKARLVAAIRSHKPIVYGADWEYNAISIPPEQAQFVETMKLTANQIASIYGIAPEEVGGEPANSLTYANEEGRQLTRMSNARPWLVRLERKFSSWLPESQFVRFNVDAAIRPDTQRRHEVYKVGREIGLYSIDEIRAMEDRPPLPNGLGENFAPLSARPQIEPRRAFNGFGSYGPYDWAIPPAGGNHE